MPVTKTYCIVTLYFLICSELQSACAAHTKNKDHFLVLTENLTATCNPTHIYVRTAVYTDRHPHEMDIYFNVPQDIKQTMYIQAIIYKSMTNSRPRPIINGKWLELCGFLAKPQVDLFMNAFVTLIHNHADRLLECPFNKMEYNVTGLQVNPSFLPRFVPNGRYVAKISLAFKKSGKTGYDQLFALVWTGELRPT